MQNSIRATILVSLFGLSCASKGVYRISDQDRMRSVLTDTYRVLSADDIGVYAWMWEPRSEKKSSGVEYWICHTSALIQKINCRDLGRDRSNGEHNADLEIEIKEGARVHSIGARRGYSAAACRAIVNEIKELINGEPYFCVGVGFIDEHKDVNGLVYVNWIYDKFKTTRGCVSYFENYCKIDYWRKFGYPMAPYGTQGYPHP